MANKSALYPDKIHYLKQANNRQWYSKIKALCGLIKQFSPLPCISLLSPSLAIKEISFRLATICILLREPAFLLPPPQLSLSRRLM